MQLFNDRLSELTGPLVGHSLGNLIIARLDHIFKGQDRGLEAARHLFGIRADVTPVSLTDVQLIMRYKSGVEIEGEGSIDERAKRSDFRPEDKPLRIYFNTLAEANPKALARIREADKIVFAPGSLYGSILPHLLVDGLSDVVVESTANVIFVLNLMTERGQTDFYKASDHVRAFLYYLGDNRRLNYLIVNDNSLDPEVLEIYRQEGQTPIELDVAECQKLAPKVKIIKRSLAAYLRRQHLLRHDPDLLASEVLSLK